MMQRAASSELALQFQFETSCPAAAPWFCAVRYIGAWLLLSHHLSRGTGFVTTRIRPSGRYSLTRAKALHRLLLCGFLHSLPSHGASWGCRRYVARASSLSAASRAFQNKCSRATRGANVSVIVPAARATKPLTITIHPIRATATPARSRVMSCLHTRSKRTARILPPCWLRRLS